MKQILNFSLYQENHKILEEQLKGEWNQSQIYFQQKEMNHILDLKEETFLRENEDYSFFLDFKNKKCHLNLKKENNTLQVNVIYAIILQNKNEIELSYKIETQEEEIKMKLVMIGGNES
ncbi:MAG: hypothetical protein IJ704_00370 [Bacilli bacterium]|nr:hypothetical protein [Bacilli bacterium]